MNHVNMVNRVATSFQKALLSTAAEQHCCSGLIRLRASASATKVPKMSKYGQEAIHTMVQELRGLMY